MAVGTDRISMGRHPLSTAAFRRIYDAMIRRLRCADRAAAQGMASIANVVAAPPRLGRRVRPSGLCQPFARAQAGGSPTA
jgi:uncharacterized protein (DUF2236 family)